jgi:hypothetical protein
MEKLESRKRLVIRVLQTINRDLGPRRFSPHSTVYPQNFLSIPLVFLRIPLHRSNISPSSTCRKTDLSPYSTPVCTAFRHFFLGIPPPLVAAFALARVSSGHSTVVPFQNEGQPRESVRAPCQSVGRADC